jgi:hypothetical protein
MIRRTRRPDNSSIVEMSAMRRFADSTQTSHHFFYVPSTDTHGIVFDVQAFPIRAEAMAIEVGRRQFVLVLASVAWPFLAYAQAQRMQVVGFLSSLNVATAGPVVSAFLRGMSESGFSEGRNVAIEYRYAEVATTGCRNSRPTWLPARSTSSSPMAGAHRHWRPRRRPRPFRSCSKLAAIRSRLVWSQALVTPVAISRA